MTDHRGFVRGWRWPIAVGVCVGFGNLVGLGGCQGPPRGSSSGRIDPAITTVAERASSKVLPVALTEFSDWVPRQLAQDLSNMPLVRDAQGRVTVIMGDINNQTGNVSSDEFELIRSRIRNNLLQSEHVRQQMRFVERSARMQALRRRELGLAGSPSSEPLDPQTTFALNGDFYRIHRGGTNQYYMEFQLVHFQTHEIVFSKRYDVKQVRW